MMRHDGDAVHAHRHDHETLPRQALCEVVVPAAARERVPGRTRPLPPVVGARLPATVREQHQRAFADERARRVHDRGEFESRDGSVRFAVNAGRLKVRSPSECSTFLMPEPRPGAAEVVGAASTIAITTAAATLPIAMCRSHRELVVIL